MYLHNALEQADLTQWKASTDQLLSHATFPLLTTITISDRKELHPDHGKNFGVYKRVLF